MRTRLKQKTNRPCDPLCLWHTPDIGRVKYLAYLSREFHVSPHDLLKSLLEAQNRRSVTCGPLRISLREKCEDHAFFLLTTDSGRIAQIKMTSVMWRELDRIGTICSMLTKTVRPLRLGAPLLPTKLKHGMRNVSLRGKVSEMSEVRKVNSRYTGHSAMLRIATLDTSLGSIGLPLWDNQVKLVSVGDEVEVKNASIRKIGGLLQIVPGRKTGEVIILKPSQSNRVVRKEPKQIVCTVTSRAVA